MKFSSSSSSSLSLPPPPLWVSLTDILVLYSGLASCKKDGLKTLTWQRRTSCLDEDTSSCRVSEGHPCSSIPEGTSPSPGTRSQRMSSTAWRIPRCLCRDCETPSCPTAPWNMRGKSTKPVWIGNYQSIPGRIYTLKITTETSCKSALT